MYTIAKPNDTKLSSGKATEADKQRLLMGLLKGMGVLDDFMGMGTDLNNPEYGPRYCKYADDTIINRT